MHLYFIQQTRDSEYINCSHTAYVYYKTLACCSTDRKFSAANVGVLGHDCNPTTHLKTCLNIIFPSPFWSSKRTFFKRRPPKFCNTHFFSLHILATCLFHSISLGFIILTTLGDLHDSRSLSLWNCVSSFSSFHIIFSKNRPWPTSSCTPTTRFIALCKWCTARRSWVG
jgi:hypothetical protein